MVALANAHGLTRQIPEAIKRTVRQRCGFGCVVCGSAFVQYDHLDPPFADATEHVASGIILLCGACHDRKTRGALSTRTVRDAASSPFAIGAGFSAGPFDIGTQHPEIRLGEVTCTNVASLICIDGESIFSIAPPEVERAPYRISAFMADSDGSEVLRIVDNEWRAAASNWDVQVEGRRLLIRRGARDIVISIRSDPPQRLVVERLHMLHRGVAIAISEGSPTKITAPGLGEMQTFDARLDGCPIGIDIDTKARELRLGVGGGSVSIGSIGMNPGRQSIARHSRNLRPEQLSRGYRYGLPFAHGIPCWCGSQVVFDSCCMPKLLRTPPFDRAHGNR